MLALWHSLLRCRLGVWCVLLSGFLGVARASVCAIIGGLSCQSSVVTTEYMCTCWMVMARGGGRWWWRCHKASKLDRRQSRGRPTHRSCLLYPRTTTPNIFQKLSTWKLPRSVVDKDLCRRRSRMDGKSRRNRRHG